MSTLFEGICIQCQTCGVSEEEKVVQWWCLHHITPYDNKNLMFIYLFKWCLLMLEIDIIFNLFIKDCMFVTSTIKNSEGCFIAKFDSNWAYSRAWGSLIIGVGWSSTSILFMGSSFKSRPKWIYLSHAKSTIQPWCTLHQRFPLLPIAHIPQ